MRITRCDRCKKEVTESFYMLLQGEYPAGKTVFCSWMGVKMGIEADLCHECYIWLTDEIR